ncbi:YeeE/YedE family protein [Constantimarinum furrinae]|uniref:YeeE/YedE family protein n=1 Tax=Constantimarinum furrinae TaxID=2562285 RepID=A0A7G8PRP1_9FLAO|nr:YeeE/YedE thiosulfate transporter family protein [Constantimarinum furrinae]QNJ97007.1 YeeE/YedE family protein [Constantimarinum furrinae]
MNWITSPWPWYVAGPLIALVMFMLLFAGKQFGMSSNLRTVCAAAGGGKKAEYFKFDWKSERWNLIVVAGAMIGGFIASNFMSDNTVQINADVAQQLAADHNIHSAGNAYLPPELYSIDAITQPLPVILLLLGGLFVGFGARYAGGCTSGHAISGLSNLQLPSLIAVIGFFIGGLVMVHLIFPLIF